MYPFINDDIIKLNNGDGMKDFDKISVIIPTYNRANVIIHSVNSVLNQTYKNIEVIVVDDCSTDDTDMVIKKITDNRLKYFKLPENHGACYARNFGVKKASGKFIAFQDSDDAFKENKLEIQMNNLIKNNSDLDFCKLKVNGKNNDWVFPGEDSIKNIKSLEIIDELCKGNVISTQTILMKKEIFNEIEFDEALPRFQDYDFVLRIAHKYKISFTDKILVDAFRQNDSISNSNNKLRKACILMLKKDYNLSQENEKTLNDTLIFWLFRTETDE